MAARPSPTQQLPPSAGEKKGGRRTCAERRVPAVRPWRSLPASLCLPDGDPKPASAKATEPNLPNLDRRGPPSQSQIAISSSRACHFQRREIVRASPGDCGLKRIEHVSRVRILKPPVAPRRPETVRRTAGGGLPCSNAAIVAKVQSDSLAAKLSEPGLDHRADRITRLQRHGGHVRARPASCHRGSSWTPACGQYSPSGPTASLG